MSHDDVNDYLFQGGAKAFQFNNIGDSVEGRIVTAELRQQTSIENVKLFWDNGDPRMQLVITLATKLQDNDEDDGLRTIYAKGGRYDTASGEGASMRDAIADAVRTMNEKRLEAGDELVVAFTGLGQAKRGYSAPKLYTAGFRKAKPGVDATALFSTPAEAAAE
jgi:hypothetical protein